jgi:hypothetical protein
MDIKKIKIPEQLGESPEYNPSKRRSFKGKKPQKSYRKRSR